MGFEFNLKEIEKYLRSSENKNNCGPYLDECRRLTKLIKKYTPECRLLYEKQSTTVVREEYSVGGQMMHRGCYCPSLIQDIVMGECSRGKLLKRKTVRSRPAYRYGFNAQNQLVVVEQMGGSLKEVVNYQEYRTTGISFNKEGRIKSLSECEYEDGRIKSYIVGNSSSFRDREVVNEYSREEYHYSEDCLAYVDWFAYTYHKITPILEHNKYIFQHDEEGYLSQYYVNEYEGNKEKKGFWDGHLFKVYLKRKTDIYENPVTSQEVLLEKQADKTINLAQIIYEQVKSVIEQWKEPDIYAISFYVEDDVNCPVVTVGYNTLSSYRASIELASSEGEAKCNYAFWLQNEEYVFGYDDTADIVMEWVEENELHDIEKDDQNQEQDEYTIPQYPATREFVRQLVSVVQRLHKEHVIEKVFHKTIPIIIHDLEYTEFFKERTKEANPGGLVDEYFEW